MSLNQHIQIIEEEHVIELFRIEYPYFPKGKLLKSESPDFILEENPKTSIGIELTKLHGPTIRKEDSATKKPSNGYQTPAFTKENFEYTIHAKDEKLHIYQRKMLNQIWLLIIANLNENPVSFNWSNQLKNWNFVSGFHKIFLLEMKSRKVFELNNPN